MEKKKVVLQITKYGNKSFMSKLTSIKVKPITTIRRFG